MNLVTKGTARTWTLDHPPGGKKHAPESPFGVGPAILMVVQMTDRVKSKAEFPKSNRRSLKKRLSSEEQAVK